MAGPFATAEAVTKRLANAENARVHVGVLGIYGAKTRGDLDDPDVTVLDIAHLAEFGRKASPAFPAVPAREPLHNTFVREVKAWSKAWTHLVGRYVATGDQRRPLVAMGVRASDDVKNTYSAGMSPALSPFTVANRRHGGDTPFVDTGATQRSNVSEITDFDGDVVIVGQER
jgi:hypothetical protein